MTREYPKRPFVGVGAVVWRNGKVLLAERAKSPRRGHWSIPGGAQELGETLREAVYREVCEETGIEIRILGLVDVASLIGFKESIIDFCFVISFIDGIEEILILNFCNEFKIFFLLFGWSDGIAKKI